MSPRSVAQQLRTLYDPSELETLDLAREVMDAQEEVPPPLPVPEVPTHKSPLFY